MLGSFNSSYLVLGHIFVWEWHPTAMIASGAVPAAMLFLTAIGFAASV